MRVFMPYNPIKKWAFSIIADNLKSQIPELQILQHPDRQSVNLLMTISMAHRKDIDFRNSIVRLASFRDMDLEHEDHIRALKQCHTIIATNNSLYEVGRKYNRNCHTIPNGLNLNKWLPRQIRNSSRQLIKAGFCGNVSAEANKEHKGFQLVQDACNGANVELLTALYGNRIMDNSRMMVEFYHNIDVLIHPSISEGCSNAVMEALACGIPVITTRQCGYHGERLTEHMNVLFCERDAQSIVDRLEEIKTDVNLRLSIGNGAREFAEKNHDLKVMAHKFKEIILKVMRDNQIGYKPYSEIKMELEALKEKINILIGQMP